jgi:hypothetical protein
MRPEVIVGIATVVVYSITVIAIIFAPIIALRVQRGADQAREAAGRKLAIFKTLMSNRATRLNPNFVQALNMIDIEFTSKSEKEVRDAWRELQDHYNDWGRKTPSRRQLDNRSDLEKAEDLLAELLVKMGRTLGYDFDKVYVKKACYYPEGLGNIEQELHALRGALLNLLSGQGAKLPVAVFTQDFQPLSVRPVPVQTQPAQRQELPLMKAQPEQPRLTEEAAGGHEESE